MLYSYVPNQLAQLSKKVKLILLAISPKSYFLVHDAAVVFNLDPLSHSKKVLVINGRQIASYNDHDFNTPGHIEFLVMVSLFFACLDNTIDSALATFSRFNFLSEFHGCNKISKVHYTVAYMVISGASIKVGDDSFALSRRTCDSITSTCHSILSSKSVTGVSTGEGSHSPRSLLRDLGSELSSSVKKGENQLLWQRRRKRMNCAGWYLSGGLFGSNPHFKGRQMQVHVI